jgi:hypothetical protein
MIFHVYREGNEWAYILANMDLKIFNTSFFGMISLPLCTIVIVKTCSDCLILGLLLERVWFDPLYFVSYDFYFEYILVRAAFYCSTLWKKNKINKVLGHVTMHENFFQTLHYITSLSLIPQFYHWQYNVKIVQMIQSTKHILKWLK